MDRKIVIKVDTQKEMMIFHFFQFLRAQFYT